jgi:hypothetical protein
MGADTTAVVALVVAIFALVIALGQLLAQIVGTVEGYRRCQASVLGKWADLSRLGWRWTQFRCETFFTTPDIVLAPYSPQRHDRVTITGEELSRKRTLVPEKESLEDPSNELVCWVPLLVALHENNRKIPEQHITNEHNWHEALRNSTWPTVYFKQRSWDFMPPDIVRPFASTSVSDVAILARRMGMTWKDFRPTEGIMEAQGRDHILSATKVRGLGIMLNYIRVSGRGALDAVAGVTNVHSNHAAPQLCVCTSEADSMWFGILPGNPDLSLRGYLIGTDSDMYATLQEIDPDGRAAGALRGLQKKYGGALHGFCDIVPMIAPWLRQAHSTINHYPRPCGNTLGLTWYCVAYKVFYVRLQQYNQTNGTAQTRKIAQTYEMLHEKYGREWDGISKGLIERPVEFFDTLEEHYHQTTEYFQEVASQPNHALDYVNLVSAHLREAPRSLVDAEKAIKEGRGRRVEHEGDRYWRGEAMHFYWDYMPDYVRYMDDKGCKNAALVEEAWITLIFRAFLWQRAHVPIENTPPLPAQYYGSRLPVYIS